MVRSASIRRIQAGALMALTCCLHPGRASAVGEDEWLVGGTLGVGLLRVGGESAVGGGLGVELVYGLSDLFAARAALGVERVGFPEFGGRPSYGTTGAALAAGAVVAFDVLRTVPFFDLGLVVTRFDAGAIGGWRAGGELGVGAEYLVDRWWSLGGILRSRLQPGAFAADGGPSIWSFSGAARVGRRW